MRGVTLWVRAEWRRRSSSLVGLVLLTGLAGAVVLAASAGARRTATSLERLVDATGAGNVVVDVGDLDPAEVSGIRRLPMVAESGAIAIVFALVDGVEEDLGLWIPRDDDAGVSVEHDRLLRGRRAGQPDEVVVNETAAALAGVDVGDDVSIATLSPEQVAREEYFPPRGPTLDLRVVGLTRGPGDLIARGEGNFVGTAALWDSVAGRADIFTTYLSVRLVPGTSAARFEDAVRKLAPDGDLGFIPLDVRLKPARDVISALALGLAVFAVVAGAVALAVIGQAVGRHVSNGSPGEEVLAALGVTRAGRVGGLVLTAAPAAIGGAVVAPVVAVLASPVVPIGLARTAEPDPGLFVDLPVLLIGAVSIAAVVAGSAAVSAWWLARGPGGSPRPVAASVLVGAARRAGARPAAENGIRLALDRRPPSLPVRSAIAGASVAVLGTLAVLTFSGSLDRLVSSPERWGQAWDLTLNFNSGDVNAAADELADDAVLEGAARWDAGFSYVDGVGVRAFGLTPLRGDMGFSLRSGRQPARDDEVVLGAVTAEELDVAVGDTVEVASAPGRSPAPVRVVGTALFPEIDEGNFTDAVGFFDSGFTSYATAPDLFEASQVVVRVAKGRDRDDVVGALADRFPGAVSSEGMPRPPGSVGNLAALRGLPRWLALFVVVLGLASLVHALVTTLVRRRLELATLRSLGFTPRQTVACIVWQALTIGTAAIALGVPLGLIVGRAAWWAVADPIGVAADATRPVLGTIAVAAGALVAAALVAVPVGHRAGRRAPAPALRAE